MPRGLNMEYDGVRNGRMYYNVRPSRFYLFKAIMKRAWDNVWSPVLFCRIVIYAFYYYTITWKGRL